MLSVIGESGGPKCRVYYAYPAEPHREGGIWQKLEAGTRIGKSAGSASCLCDVSRVEARTASATSAVACWEPETWHKGGF